MTISIQDLRVETQNLDHLGLVAGMCDEIGLTEAIDAACGQQAKNKHLTYGECVKCMILNGLGFVGRTLYLYSEYFEDKPTDLLISPSVEHQHIDDNVLGRTLDRLFQVGVTDLYTKIALSVVKHLGIQVSSLHLDSTSFHVDGAYEGLLGQGEGRIQIIPGYSRDHRPDLNQVVLQLITSNQGNIPLFMQAASGNSSDKSAFAEIVQEHLASFQAAVNNRYLVGDSALYTPDSLTAVVAAKGFFVTRVLKTYKSQQSVERGFRFLKSPDFLVSSFFLKKPERIEALLMVMTLCLLIYSALEYKVRQKLRETGEHFPDQLRKPSQNPTTRWIFFCFLGLHVVILNGQKRQVTNLKDYILSGGEE